MRPLSLIMSALVVLAAAGCGAELDHRAVVSKDARQPLFGIVELERGQPGASYWTVSRAGSRRISLGQ
jgi:hypothetical protein